MHIHVSALLKILIAYSNDATVICVHTCILQHNQEVSKLSGQLKIAEKDKKLIEEKVCMWSHLVHTYVLFVPVIHSTCKWS